MQILLIIGNILIFTTVRLNTISVSHPKKTMDPSILAEKTKILSIYFKVPTGKILIQRRGWYEKYLN